MDSPPTECAGERTQRANHCGWLESPLGDRLTLKRGYDLPAVRRVTGAVPIYSSSGKSGFHDAKMADGPGVVTGRYGTIGEVFYSPGGYWPLNTTLYVHDFKGNDPKFVFYFLKQLDWEKYSDKSAVPGVNRNEVHKELVFFPNTHEQSGIAATLWSLDEKIALLRCQSQTLEAMAEALYKQWFEFDTNADWPEGTVENLFVLQRGFDLPTQQRQDGPYPVLSSSGRNGSHSAYKVEAPGVTTGRSGIIGNVFLVQEPFWPLNTSLYVREFRRGTPAFTYFFLKAMDLPAFNAGSAVPTLNRNHVHAQRVQLPPRELIERFDAAVWPLLQKIHHNEQQTVKLESLRDTLLPKLMSGEVRVAL